jgi:hypothetical protein
MILTCKKLLIHIKPQILLQVNNGKKNTSIINIVSVALLSETMEAEKTQQKHRRAGSSNHTCTVLLD